LLKSNSFSRSGISVFNLFWTGKIFGAPAYKYQWRHPTYPRHPYPGFFSWQ
jgi:hypothetical protein